jgi:tripeptidyl-peptidase-1
VVTAIISLFNDFRISKGQSALGWVNPWLYDKGPGNLDDILEGSNPGCGTNGLSAIEGWDPVRPARLMFLHFRRWLIFVLPRSRV